MSKKKPTYQDLEKLIVKLKSENKQIKDRFEEVLKSSEDNFFDKNKQLELEEQLLFEEKNKTTLKLLERRKYSMDEASKIAKIGYWEHNLINDEIIWSDFIYQIFELNPNDGVPPKHKIAENFDKESLKRLEQATINLISKGTPSDIELKWRNSKKEDVWIRNVAQPIYNQQNEIVGKRGVMQDITESKKAQLDLEVSSQKFQSTLALVKENEYSLKEAGRMAKIGYWKFEHSTNTLFWSDAIYQIYGRDPKLGIPEIDAILNVYSKKSRKLVLESLKKLTDKGIPYDIELEFINFKNEKRWIRNIGEPIYNDKNKIIGRRGVSQDITQRKLNEKESDIKNEQLKKLNKALNEAQKLSSIGSWQWNMVTDEAEWSDEMYNIYGVNKEDFYPSHENAQKYTLPEDIHKIEKGVNSLLIDNVFVPFNFRIKRPTGEIRHLHIVALEMNSKESVFGVTKDITERKKIEDENLRIQENYRRLFNNATVSIWNEDLSLVIEEIDKLKKVNIPNITIFLEKNPETLFNILKKLKVNKVNKATLELFKAKNNDDFLKNIESTFSSGADKVFGKLIEAIYNKDKTFTSEVNYKTLKGDEFAAIISIPIPQTVTEQKTVPVSIQSIQSIKDAELENKESLMKLNEAQKLAKLGSWYFVPSSEEVVCSDETFHIFGFNPSKSFPKVDEFLKIVHKDDQELLLNAMTQDQPYDIEYRVSLSNGVKKTVRTICQPILGENGKVLRLEGSTQDITELKKAKIKIEKTEEMYRLLAENSNDLICLQEPNSTFKYISPSVENLLGYNQSDFIGKEVFSIVHPEEIEELKETMYQKKDKITFTKPYDIRIRHKKGHYVWFEFLTSPVFKNDKISYFVTSARDISLWVSAKQEIDEYQSSLQKLTTEMTLLEENQKKEIASNIHDHLSQSLVISKMKINELKKKSELRWIDEDLKFIEKHISEVLENSRKITYELSPPVLYQLGIIDALNWLIENVETTHKINCKVNSNVSNINLNDVKSIIVYRCIQELIKNVIKYADASLLTLDLNSNENGINILLVDNGNGFDTSILNNYKSQTKSGFGLFAVKERIKNIQGEFTITSKINEGTSVNIFIPISK